MDQSKLQLVDMTLDLKRGVQRQKIREASRYCVLLAQSGIHVLVCRLVWFQGNSKILININVGQMRTIKS